jgi:hypothetical protein
MNPTSRARPLQKRRRQAILSQSERADPGVWLTLCYRKAKAGKRLANSAQAVGVFDNRPVTVFRCDEIVVFDVIAGLT